MDALAAAPTAPEFGRVVEAQRVHIRDKVQAIIQALRKTSKITFQEILRASKSRLEIVISFLALLELIKLHQVKAQQETLFGDIELTPGDGWRGDQEVDFELEFEE
jgi:segregation and condensation protein A